MNQPHEFDIHDAIAWACVIVVYVYVLGMMIVV